MEKHGAVLRGELADTEEFALTVFANAGIGVHGVGTFRECGVLVDVVINEGFDCLEEGVLPVGYHVIVDVDGVAVEGVVDVTRFEWWSAHECVDDYSTDRDTKEFFRCEFVSAELMACVKLIEKGGSTHTGGLVVEEVGVALVCADTVDLAGEDDLDCVDMTELWDAVFDIRVGDPHEAVNNDFTQGDREGEFNSDFT